MKSQKPLDHLQLLRNEIASLAVVKCHMSHERIRREGGSMLPVVSRLSESGYQRVGLCSYEVRAQRLGCSHTTARIKLQDAINGLKVNGERNNQWPLLESELNWLNNEIHLLDHRKGEAEKTLARIEEETSQPGNQEHRGEELIAAREVVLEMERLHDEYVALIGTLRDKVVNELESLSVQADSNQDAWNRG
jgi:hypothetical protein